MTYETLIYRQQDAVTTISLNRPDRLNAVNQTLYNELDDALNRAESDRHTRVLVLTGEGRAFCVGADLKEHKAGRTPFDRRQYLMGQQVVCRRLMTQSKPVIAAINGFALGAGAELALSCDFILMADTAQLGFPELSLGNYLGGGVTWILPRLVGLAKARELVFLGERINGEEAQRIGLVNRCWSSDDFTDKVYEFAHTVSAKAPFSMQLAKRHLNLATESTLEAAMMAELEGMMFVGTTKDWQEGVNAFAEKRRPVFKGE